MAAAAVLNANFVGVQVGSHCFFCSNVPLILLISPCKFQEFAKKDKIRPQKNKVHFGHNLAKISYMRVNVNVVHTDALAARL